MRLLFTDKECVTKEDPSGAISSLNMLHVNRSATIASASVCIPKESLPLVCQVLVGDLVSSVAVGVASDVHVGFGRVRVGERFQVPHWHHVQVPDEEILREVVDVPRNAKLDHLG